MADTKQIGLISADCFCGDCAAPATGTGTGTGTSGTGTGVSIVNNFYPINNDSNILQSPADGSVVQEPPPGGQTTQPVPLPEPPTQTGEGTTATLPPGSGTTATDTGGGLADITSNPAWWLILVAAFVGYQILKPGKTERHKKRKKRK